MATWTGTNRTETTWDSTVGFLLKESLDFLLLETGDRIMLDQSTFFRSPATFTNSIRN